MIVKGKGAGCEGERTGKYVKQLSICKFYPSSHIHVGRLAKMLLWGSFVNLPFSGRSYEID